MQSSRTWIFAELSEYAGVGRENISGDEGRKQAIIDSIREKVVGTADRVAVFRQRKELHCK